MLSYKNIGELVKAHTDVSGKWVPAATVDHLIHQVLNECLTVCEQHRVDDVDASSVSYNYAIDQCVESISEIMTD